MGPMKPDRGDQEMWVFPNVTLTEKEKREVIATVVQIAVEQMFSSHLYTFGGSFYRQAGGGPIGLRSTCAVARLAMQMWDLEWQQKLDSLRIMVEDSIR
jgi:hypothetical protein